MTDTTISALEAQQERLLEENELDGADIITVLCIVADDHELDLLGFLNQHAEYAGMFIAATQSNPKKSEAIIREWAELDARISTADGTD